MVNLSSIKIEKFRNCLIANCKSDELGSNDSKSAKCGWKDCKSVEFGPKDHKSAKFDSKTVRFRVICAGSVSDWFKISKFGSSKVRFDPMADGFSLSTVLLRVI